MREPEDELTERRERREDDGMIVAGLGPKGRALMAALEERDRQRPGERDDIYEARKILTEGAAFIGLQQVMVRDGYMRPVAGLPPLGPAGTCMAPSRPGSRERCKRKPVMFGLCQRHLDEADAEADREVAARKAPAAGTASTARQRPGRSDRDQEAAKAAMAARRREADERRAERRRERDARRAEEREPFEGQCTGLTKSGRRCRFVAVAGGRCPLHGGSAGPEGP